MGEQALSTVERTRLLVRDLLDTLRRWPWFETLRTLRERFREDRLGLTAGSLTFTTLIALVPLVTVMLAVFTVFPIFAGFEVAMEKYFLNNLVPDAIAKPVMRALTQFAAKARGMGSLGLVLLVVTALALVLTIDRTLNAIWRVRQPRPLGQRVLVYWAALTLGPLVLGMSLTLTSWIVSSSRGWVVALPGSFSFLLELIQFGLLAAAAAGLFHYVPNIPVRWRHAWAGGLFVSIAFEIAKELLTMYLATVPSYSAIYGAFAAVPILLLWIYLVWVIVLLGAVIAAYAPALQMRVTTRPATPGWRFELAMAVLRELDTARRRPERGVSLAALGERLRADPLQLEPMLELLAAIDWVQRLDEPGEPRHLLLCDPAHTPLLPLVQRTLLAPGAASAPAMAASGLGGMTLQQALGR
ncbi:MAG: YihY family inner membrane protein [Rubrivivax sp.]|nr:YihY family inner membrane protein [Rubrivivax sp.]